MNILGRLTVLPTPPEKLSRLRELANNLQWTWNSSAERLFERLDPHLWEESNRNPVVLLQAIAQERLDDAATDEGLLELYEDAVSFMDGEKPAGAGDLPLGKNDLYAYFCAEYGWHESIPLYSGGLGILAGDHTKAASDLGVPLVAVGLWYPEGYFQQRVARDGEQEAVFTSHRPEQLPLSPALKENGERATITVPLFGRLVSVRAWYLMVGRVKVILLDTDFEENEPRDREILRRLYGGDQRTRISQEIVLGIGGVRMLRALGLAPTSWHMNEGHSAFMALERCRELVQEQGLSFAAAREAVSGGTVFTVHTPVAAGNDGFPFALAEQAFAGFWEELGLSRDEFLNLARSDHGWGPVFSMPALALRFTSGRNGVAQLHGETSRMIWSDLWPGVPEDEVPIGHITNGVHVPTWMAPEVRSLVAEVAGPKWREQLGDEKDKAWQAVHDMDPARLWAVRQDLKRQSLQFLRGRLGRQLGRQQATDSSLALARELFDPRALTIGFARRFATYKRATLIFRDLERLEAILGEPERPVQLIFSGKAHPADRPGQELIKTIQLLSQDPRFSGRILFVEDYDMAVGRALTRGVDVWLNNPRRPLEASGTSGQKAAMNGILNLSILDCWWREGFEGENGSAFGSDSSYHDEEHADAADADQLYSLLEREVIPLYYQRDEHGVPVEWMRRSANAIGSITRRFNAQRMVREYVENYYAPASERGRSFKAGDYRLAKELAGFRERLAASWDKVYLSAKRGSSDSVSREEPVQIEAVVNLGDLKDIDVRVEVVYSHAVNELQRELQVAPMSCVETYTDGSCLYRANFTPLLTGDLVYGVRAYPVHPAIADPFDLHAVKWA